MKTIALLKKQLSRLLVFAFMLGTGTVILAQESTEVVNSTKTTTTTEWYADPTYLIIGAVVLIIIVALLAMRGRRKD
ncbi:hypothetical protein [Chryseobacterium tongliaoense]|uniref:hypothetical protein n=1 Tax=Chryseobacterium tongliaoense TaxID=3240933 RepID=UPI003512D4F9